MVNKVIEMSDVLATANNTIAISNFVLTYGLGIITLLGLIATLAIQYWLAKDKKQQIKDAIADIVNQFSNNDSLREEMIKKILANEDFQSKFNALIDNSINDKLDDKVKNGIEDTLISTLKKGLDNDK